MRVSMFEVQYLLQSHDFVIEPLILILLKMNISPSFQDKEDTGVTSYKEDILQNKRNIRVF
jgi:hypothetical protein